MPLLTVVLILAAVGIGLLCLKKYGASIIDAELIKIINVVVIVAVVLWLLYLFGIMDYINAIHVGKR